MGYYGGDGRPQGRHRPALRRAAPDTARLLERRGHRADRLRQLGGVGLLDGARRRRLGHLLRQARARGRGPPAASHVVFIVRDDDGSSDLLFQTSDTTWQAYNQYGGNSLYTGNPGGTRVQGQLQPAVHHAAARTPEDWVFNAEYPMVRWLERNGYDVSYFTGVDSDRRGAEILEHEVFLSVGHDEYWSGGQRTNVEAARDAGVNLAFFSGNEVFWKTRWENEHRRVRHDAPHARLLQGDARQRQRSTRADVWTGHLARHRAISPRGRAARERPHRARSSRSTAGTTAIEVPAADGKMRFWRNTARRDALGPADGDPRRRAPSATSGTRTSTTAPGPPGLFRCPRRRSTCVSVLQDHGSSYGPGPRPTA